MTEPTCCSHCNSQIDAGCVHHWYATAQRLIAYPPTTVHGVRIAALEAIRNVLRAREGESAIDAARRVMATLDRAVAVMANYDAEIGKIERW